MGINNHPYRGHLRSVGARVAAWGYLSGGITMQQLQLFSCDDLLAGVSRQGMRGRSPERKLREALAPYLDLATLQRLAATPSADLRQAIIADGEPPAEVLALLDTVVMLLRPSERVQIKSPADVAALLMAEMGHLDQEHLRTVLLDTKNRVQAIHTIYIGTLNCSTIRVCEVFKEALRRNSAALILCHNHPTADTTPSPEDVAVTREIVVAGKLLECEVLDHLIIGAGRWTSLREQGLGFPK
jgi:DNA repair protein RadC